MKLGTLAIVGVGLIGGSIGKAAKKRGLAARIVGVEPNADLLRGRWKTGCWMRWFQRCPRMRI